MSLFKYLIIMGVPTSYQFFNVLVFDLLRIIAQKVYFLDT